MSASDAVVVLPERTPPEFIGVDERKVIGRSEQCDVCLSHPSVSPVHAVLEQRGESLCVSDRESQFGTFKNNQRKRFAVLVPGDQIRFGMSPTYTVELQGLRLAQVTFGSALAAHSVNLAKDGRLLLEGLNFSIAPNSFVGILGPSGAGKSTVLQMLAGYLAPASGWLEVDSSQNVYADEEFHQRGIGFVAQDDIVFSTLTIRENLTFAARLRFGATEREGEIDAIVEEALHRLELESVADNIRYSGGQRKRLSVAIELLKQPRLLLLDEPTSGLDPAADHNLIEQLRKLTSKGTTVVCTTHQLADLDLYDQLLVLGMHQPGGESRQGEMSPKQLHQLLKENLPDAWVPLVNSGKGRRTGCLAYDGPPQLLLPSFRCPTMIQAFESLSYGNFEPLPVPAVVKEPPPQPVRNDEFSLEDLDLSLRGLQQSSMRAMEEAGASIVRMAQDVSLWKQFSLLIYRQFLIGLRDPYLLASLVAQPLALGLLMALSQFRSSAELYVEFFMIILTLWLGMNNSVRDLVRDRKTFVRERLAGMSIQGFYLSRVAFHLVIGLVQVALLLTTVTFIGGIVFAEDTWRHLGLFWRGPWLFVVLVAVHFAGVSMGLFVSAVANSEESAIAALPLLIMPQLLISAVATGQADVSINSSRCFAPILHFASQSRDSVNEIVVDSLSLFCVSRPALILSDERLGWITIGDFLHLWILVASTLTAAYAVFLTRQKTWPKLVGLG